jgi:hypothetical protein
MSGEHDIAFSRTPGRDIFGPLDDKLPEIRIPAEVKIAATRAAHEQGIDLTAWLRELVYGTLFGAKHVASLYEDRIQRVLGNARQEPDGLDQGRGRAA